MDPRHKCSKGRLGKGDVANGHLCAIAELARLAQRCIHGGGDGVCTFC